MESVKNRDTMKYDTTFHVPASSCLVGIRYSQKHLDWLKERKKWLLENSEKILRIWEIWKILRKPIQVTYSGGKNVSGHLMHLYCSVCTANPSAVYFSPVSNIYPHALFSPAQQLQWDDDSHTFKAQEKKKDVNWLFLFVESTISSKMSGEARRVSGHTVHSKKLFLYCFWILWHWDRWRL